VIPQITKINFLFILKYIIQIKAGQTNSKKMSLQDSACSKDSHAFSKPFQAAGLFPKPLHHSSKNHNHEEKIATYIAKILSNEKDQELEGLTGIRKLLSIADNRK